LLLALTRYPVAEVAQQVLQDRPARAVDLLDLQAQQEQPAQLDQQARPERPVQQAQPDRLERQARPEQQAQEQPARPDQQEQQARPDLQVQLVQQEREQQDQPERQVQRAQPEQAVTASCSPQAVRGWLLLVLPLRSSSDVLELRVVLADKEAAAAAILSVHLVEAVEAEEVAALVEALLHRSRLSMLFLGHSTQSRLVREEPEELLA